MSEAQDAERAVIYTRNGIDEDVCRRYIEEQGWVLAGTYVHWGSLPARGLPIGLATCCGEIKDSGVRHVVIPEPTKLARRAIPFETYQNAVRDAGAEIHFAKLPDTIPEALAVRLMTAVAEREDEIQAAQSTEPAPVALMTWELPFERLAGLPLDTVVISADNTRWIVGAARDGNLRALIPVPRWPVERGQRPSWLYFNRHREDIEAKGPWRLASEPRQVNAEELAGEAARTVVLDRHGQACGPFTIIHTP